MNRFQAFGTQASMTGREISNLGNRQANSADTFIVSMLRFNIHKYENPANGKKKIQRTLGITSASRFQRDKRNMLG